MLLFHEFLDRFMIYHKATVSQFQSYTPISIPAFVLMINLCDFGLQFIILVWFGQLLQAVVIGTPWNTSQLQQINQLVIMP
jgi:hypothetical protein